MLTRWLATLHLIICTTGLLFAQLPDLTVVHTSELPEIDGIPDEAVWLRAPVAHQFHQIFPTDSLAALSDTEIRFLYDDQNLYIAIYCHAAGPNFVVPNLRRDYRAGGSDNITLIFDTFGDQTNAYFFGINPYGVRREGLIANGGNDVRDFSESWDNRWSGEARRGADFWSAELVIPFRTLRYNQEGRNWRFNAYRFDTQSNERTNWTQIPRNQWMFNLGYTGEIRFSNGLSASGGKVSVIPYVSGSYGQDFESNGDPDLDGGVGGDAKIAVTSGLNLDLTVNPDFSQVEVDRQVTDLSRFELFFPERRQFFLENADLFGSFGSRNINPFFSRRIGIVRDTAAGLNVANPIQYGARLSGKLNDNLRLGLLNMQTADNPALDLLRQNYTVAVLQQRVFGRSNLGAIFVNKQSVGRPDSIAADYNRIIGLDYNIATPNNVLTGKAFYHHALSPETNRASASGLRLTYLKRRYSLTWRHRFVDEDYEAAVGFVPRTNYFRISPEAQFYIYDKGNLTEQGPGVEANFFLQPGFGKTDHQLTLFYNLVFRNTMRIRMELSHQYTYLFGEFDPSKSDAEPLPADRAYQYTALSGSIRTDRRRPFSVQVRPYIGQFFNGYRYGSNVELNLRLQPFAQLALRMDYNYIDLPEPYAQTSLFLVGPRADITFTKSIFLTAFVQYNTQSENLNINTRFQWRFAPVSDFFLVYTDNYLTVPFGVRNRALVAKLTYWLNL